MDTTVIFVFADRILLINHREEGFIPFFTPLNLELDETTILSFANFFDEKGNKLLLRELIGAEIIEETLLTVNDCAFFEFIVLIVNL